MSKGIHAVRGLLRAIRQRISPKSQNSMWHDYVIEEYRRHAGETDPAKLQHLSQLVQDYTNLVHDVHYERVRCCRADADTVMHGRISCVLWLWDPAFRVQLNKCLVQELLLSYNIGVDRDARQRRMVQSTAARVGLRLPTTDDGQVRRHSLKSSLTHQASMLVARYH